MRSIYLYSMISPETIPVCVCSELNQTQHAQKNVILTIFVLKTGFSWCDKPLLPFLYWYSGYWLGQLYLECLGIPHTPERMSEITQENQNLQLIIICKIENLTWNFLKTYLRKVTYLHFLNNLPLSIISYAMLIFNIIVNYFYIKLFIIHW